MTQQAVFRHFAAFILLALPFVYAGWVWEQLPEIIPVHFGASGAPDRFGDKSELWVILSILGGAGAFSWLLINNIEKIDPKKAAQRSPEVMQKIALLVVVLTSVIGIYAVRATLKGSVDNILLVILGFFLAYLGNMMHSLKSNYFVGIRLPWTLENESNWRKTHQLGSKIWTAGGLIIMLAALLLPTQLAVNVLLVMVVIMTVIPIVYSYRIHQSERAL